MESSLKNMVITLGAITLVAATGLGLVYSVTKDPIAAAKSAKTTDALANVLPEFDNNPAADTTTLTLDGLPIIVYEGKKGPATSGYAVETQTKNGFSGLIRMIVGFKPDGGIVNIEVLEQNETPGLGSKISEPENVLLVSFVGKNPADLKMKVVKDGGDIDAITASTITSRAYTDAVDRAYKAFRAVAFGDGVGDQEEEDPFGKVLPGYTNNPLKSKTTVTYNKVNMEIYTGVKDGEIIGYAVESESNGHGGVMKMLVGFTPDGRIIDIAVTEHSETPGYAGAITEEGNALAGSFKGRDLAEMNMSIKSEGNEDGEINGISGATITTNAYIEAVQKAYEAFKLIKKEEVKNE